MTMRISGRSVVNNEKFEKVLDGYEENDGEDGRLEQVERARIAHRAIGRPEPVLSASEIGRPEPVLSASEIGRPEPVLPIGQ